MLHVNRLDGMTIAVSENRISLNARRTVLSDDALSVLVPVLEEIGRLNAAQIPLLFSRRRIRVAGMDKVRTDSIMLADSRRPRSRWRWHDGGNRVVRERGVHHLFFFRNAAALRRMQALAACL